MKELSIEQKVKTIEVVKQMVADGQISQDVAEKYFPELKESYEERISKAIIDFFSEPGRKEYILNGFTVGDIIAWLEKQGDKQKPVVIIPKFRVGDTIRIKNSDAEYTITEISDGYYRGKGWCLDIAAGDECGDYELVEQKPDIIIPKFRVGDIVKSKSQPMLDARKIISIGKDCYLCEDRGCIGFAWEDDCELVENKTAWSEEDYDMLYKATAVINRLCAEGKEYVWSVNTLKKLFYWLKSIKARVQPKQEWNKEDINMIDWLIRCCEKEHEELCNDKYGHQDIVSDLKRDCRKKWDWLESLKNRVAPQKQWKPSKEQMEALLSEVEAWTKGCPKQVILESLYNDLKKLREG